MVSGNMVRSGLSRRNTGPRVAFVGEDDDWSLFSNPECSHERHCGHIVAPRILFRPDRIGPAGRVDGPSTRLPFPELEHPPLLFPFTHKFKHLSVFQCTGEDMGSQRNISLPSNIGPFRLESLPSGGSVAEDRE